MKLQRVLAEKLGFGGEQTRAVCDLLVEVASARPDPPGRVDSVTGDPADDAILASAVEAIADVLATGDRKHLLPIGKHRGMRILIPQAVLAELPSTD